MAKKLLVVETPGKADKIGSILNAMQPNQWVALPSMGWPCEMLPHEVPPRGRPLYKIRDRSELVLSKLRLHARNADDVYIATDPTLEGEALAWHLQELLQLKNAKRIELHEITPVEIASATPRPIDMRLVEDFENWLFSQKAEMRFELQKKIEEEIISAEIPERGGPNVAPLYPISRNLSEDSYTFGQMKNLMRSR